jgi:CHAT domain-containing protein/tetratricopeptide (TPR) repeat protein
MTRFFSGTQARRVRSLGLAVACLWILATFSDTVTKDSPVPRREREIVAPKGTERYGGMPDSCGQALTKADQADETIHDLVVRGRYRPAYALAKRQMETRQRLLGPDHLETTRSLLTLADVTHLRGDRGGALDLRARALAIRRGILGDRHLLVAEAFAAVGRSEKSIFRLERAESLHTAALDIRRDRLGEESLEFTESLVDLADVYRAGRRYEAALELLDRSLRIRRKLLPADDPEIAETLCMTGLVHLQQGAWVEAEPYLRSAARIAASNPDTPAESRALIFSLCVDIASRRGDLEQAERYAIDSVRLYETIFREGLPAFPPSHGVGDWWKIARLQVTQGKGEPAWESLERGLSRSLLDELYPPDTSRTEVGRDRDMLQDSRFCSLSELERILPADAAVIGWLEGSRNSSDFIDYPYWAYVIRSTGPIAWVKIEPPPGSRDAAQSKALSSYLGTIRSAAEWPLQAQMKPGILKLAQIAYTERIAPLLPHLAGVRRLFVVKGGTMQRFAIESLADSSGVFLGDRFETSYLLSSTLFVRMHECARRQRSPRAWRALLVGGDSNGAPHNGVYASVERTTGTDHDPMPPLPGACDEIRKLATLFHGARVLPGGCDQIADLRRLAGSDSLHRFDLIHIATHAAVSSAIPMESALVFSSPTPSPTRADSSAIDPYRDFLRPQEILSSWRLNADLVTLSACKSDVGASSFCEPVSGICHALFLTGAKSLLTALWTVDDRATSLLMGRFYENLTGAYTDVRAGEAGLPMSKPQALQEAKHWLRELRDPDGSRPFENPAQWAAFVLIGDPGSLSEDRPAEACRTGPR